MEDKMYYPQMMKDVQSAVWTAGCTLGMYKALKSVEEQLILQSGMDRKEWDDAMGYAVPSDRPERIPPHLREELSKTHITVVLEEYRRFEEGLIRVLHIAGKNIKDALDIMFRNVHLYTGSVDELEEEYDRSFTVSDILKCIEDQNGDGCDSILFIRNDDTGEVIYDTEFFKEEDI